LRLAREITQLQPEPSAHVLLAAAAAEEARALEIVILQVGTMLPVCDYFVICHSRSAVHGEAICDKIQERMAQAGVGLHHREGAAKGEWTILDYLDVVVHIFSERARRFYALERLWAEAPRVEFEPALPHASSEPGGGEP